MRKRTLVTALIPIIMAVGSFYKADYTPYTTLAAVAIIGIEAFFINNKKDTAFILWCLSLTVLWSVTMWGDYIVGIDIHTEYATVNQVIRNGWNINNYDSNNTSFVLAFVAPFLAHWIPVVWQFKVIYPLVFSFAPVLLYLAYYRIFGHKTAWLASLYIITMPMFSFETTSMVKGMVAQFGLALFVNYLTVQTSKKQTAVLIMAGIVAGLSHYAVAAVLSFYTFTIGLISGIYYRKLVYKYAMYLLSAGVIIAVGITWYSVVGQGTMLNTAKATVANLATVTKEVVNSNKPELNTALLDQYQARTEPTKTGTYLDSQEQLVRAAIGLDFNEVSAWGKAQRIVQFIILYMMLFGVIVIAFSRSIPIEFKAGTLAGLALLLGCIFVPFLSTVGSASRFYQLTLYFTAPAIFVGLRFFVRKAVTWVKYYLQSVSSS